MTCVLGGGCATSPASGLAEREGEAWGGRRGVCAHCGKQGRSKALGRDGGTELEHTASSGSAWSLPGGERSRCHFPCHHTLKPGHMRPHGGVPLLTCPAQTPSLSPGGLSPICPDGCHRQRVPWEEETTSFWPERRIKG